MQVTKSSHKFLPFVQFPLTSFPEISTEGSKQAVWAEGEKTWLHAIPRTLQGRPSLGSTTLLQAEVIMHTSKHLRNF